MNSIVERLDTDVVKRCDVVVCGGGPAGIAAALAAARAGAETALIEVHGCLGGVWTAGNLSWVLDANNKDGIMRELIEHLERRDAGRSHHGRGIVYDPEAMKCLLEELCLKAGVHLRYHTRVCSTHVENGRLRAAMTESKSGREAWAAGVFVDCSGDGDLAAQAGCAFDLGHPETGQVQPMSMTVVVDGLDEEEIAPFIGGGLREPKERLFREIREAGVELSTSIPLLLRIYPDLYAFMGNHQYGASAIDADEVTQATIEARREFYTVVEALKNKGGIWRNMRIVSTGNQIGIREARRIRGLETVTLQDMVAGRQHVHSACRVTFNIDVHALSKDSAGGAIEKKPGAGKTQPYDIPMGALIAKDVDGLLMAGRCISGDFWAHSSYRVTGNAVALGEAAGRLAAECALGDEGPHARHAKTQSAVGA